MTNSKKSNTSAGASSAHSNNIQQEARNMRQARAARQQVAANAGERRPRPQPDVALPCPRCHATNTKFCYYNNYNMLQPRYLCKACKRYWTHGGSQRNIPVGGASRKQSKRSSVSLSLPAAASSSSVINKELQQQLLPAAPMIEPAADFNVFPSFMSTGFEHHGNQLPFSPAPAPLPLPTLLPPAPVLAPDAGTPSFLDMLRGGFLDYQNNGFYAPATPSTGMEAPPPLPFGGAAQPGVAGGRQGGGAAPTGGHVDATAAGQGAAWPKPQVRGNQQGGAGALGKGRA